MIKENKIIIKEKFHFFLFLIVFASLVLFIYIGFDLYSKNNIKDKILGLSSTIFFSAVFVLSFIHFVRPKPYVAFERSGITIKGYRNFIKVPWDKVKKIGIQKLVVVFENSLNDSFNKWLNDSSGLYWYFLVISFSDPKYKIKFSCFDKKMFPFNINKPEFILCKLYEPFPEKKLEDFMGKFKGDLYILLSLNMSLEEIHNLPKEFYKKLSVKLEEFPILLKTKDEKIYNEFISKIKDIKFGE